jgi:hypothetical protein
VSSNQVTLQDAMIVPFARLSPSIPPVPFVGAVP